MKNILKDRRTRLVITLLHMICVFLWQGRVFKNVGINPSGTRLLSGALPDIVERTVTYTLSVGAAFVLIYCFWRLLFCLIADFRREYLIFLGIYVAGAVFIALLWPDIFTYVAGNFDDNVVTYACAVRLTPDYWHSIYQSVLYCAALLFFPVDFMIPLAQWTLYVFVLAYIFERAKKLNYKRRWLIFLVFFIPDNIMLMGYGHRIMIYMGFVMVYAAMIVFDMLEGRERTLAEDIRLAVLGAFLSVYRSEGIIIGVLFYGIYVLFHGKRSLKRILGTIGLFALFFVMFTLPQKMGSNRYYGDDYSILNAMEPLKEIINADESVIYADDWNGINRLMPSAVIAQYGADGFRRYNNVVTGNPDIDQTGAGKDRSSRFKAAYRHVLLNNKGIYLKYVWGNFYRAATGRYAYYPSVYPGEDQGLYPWTYVGWDNGRADLFGNHHTVVWRDVTSKFNLLEPVKKLSNNWTGLLKKTYVYFAGIILLFAANIVLFAAGVVKTVKTRDKRYIGLGFVSLAIVVLFIATIMVMPEAWSIYLMISGHLFMFVALFACV